MLRRFSWGWENEGYTYGRAHNPTWTELEEAIGGLEGGGVRVFGSGMGAVAAVMGVVLRAGDTVAIQNGYFGVRQLLREVYEPMGVTVRMGLGDLRGVRLAWVETPSNPVLEIVDLREVCGRAREAGALVAVDNTTASPWGQKPLGLGADFSVCSDSKAMCGHSDLVLGHVACGDKEWLGKVDRWRNVTGGIAGPMEAWLALRSLATVGLRLERSAANALGIAEMLIARGVAGVVYPGLAGHPGHGVAAGQMTCFGPVLGFDLGTREAAEGFLGRCELVTVATSFGGVSTTAERRRRWGHDGVGEGFIRLSAGCEELEDLLADIGGALV